MVDLRLLRLLITSIVVLLPSFSESVRQSAEDMLSGPLCVHRTQLKFLGVVYQS